MENCIKESTKGRKRLLMIATIFAIQIMALVAGIVFETNKVNATAGIITNIAITTPATKTTYAVGEDFDPTGMVVTDYLKDMRGNIHTSTTTDYTIIDGENLQQGTNYVTLVLNNGGDSMIFATHQIVVGTTAPASYTLSIVVTKPPTKTIYKDGQQFNTEGMEITAIKKDNAGNVTTTTNVTDYSIIYEGEEETTIQTGDTYIAIAYQNAILTYQIQAYSTKVITGIEVTTQPTQTIYNANEKFNPAGMVLKAIYNDDTTKVVTNYTIGEIVEYNNVTYREIVFNGNYALVPITMIEKSVTSIAVTTPSSHTGYYKVGEDFDRNGNGSNSNI